MKLEFTVVKPIFNSYNNWSDSNENYMYQYLWDVLEKAGLTEYETELDMTTCKLRAFTLIMLYGEFCELDSGLEFSYEFADWSEHESIDLFEIGVLAERLKAYDVSADKDSVFLQLIQRQRYQLADVLMKSNQYGPSDVYVAMILGGLDLDSLFADIEDEESSSHHLELEGFEKFIYALKKMVDIVYSDDEAYTSSENEAYGWWCQGTFSIR